MTNNYELTDDEVNEMYDCMFTQKEQFVHMADPDKQSKLHYVEEKLDSDDDGYIHALVLYRDSYASYGEAYDDLSDYVIYAGEDIRNADFEQLIHEQAECAVEDALAEGRSSWLKLYIDVDEIADDMAAERSYAEILSPYEEEIEGTVDGTTYYLYRN